MCGFPKRNCLGLQNPPPPTQSLLVFAARSCGDLSSWHWNPGLGAWCGSGTPRAQDIPPKVLSMWVWEQPAVHPHPSYQSAWMWFLKSRSCQTSIQPDSDVPECWLLPILGVTLMSVCEEVSLVCLCHHLDWKPFEIHLLYLRNLPKYLIGIHYIPF